MKEDIEKIVKQESRMVPKVPEDGEEAGPLEMVEKMVNVPYFKIPREPMMVRQDTYIAEKEARKRELITHIENSQNELADLEIEIAKLKAL